MARKLHTAVADEIHRVAKTDPDRAAEMRMSPEYAAEVRGDFDYDTEDMEDRDMDDPYDDRDVAE